MLMVLWPTARHRAKAMLSPILFTLLTCCLCVAAVNPGLQLAVTENGLKYVADVGIPLLIEQLKTASIPPMSGRADTPVGHFDYDLSNIKLESFAIPTYSLTSESAGLELKTSGVSASVHADWHYREESWPHVSDSGSADISMTSSSLELSVALGRNPTNNHFTIKATGCSVNIGHLSVDFHGGASWLYNLFNDQIADSLKDSLSKSLCSTAIQYIDTSGNVAVESIPIVAKIDSTSEINYELISDPIFQSAYIQTQHKGEFYSIAKPVEAPVTTPPIPAATSVDLSKMIYVWVSTFVPNSAAFVYQQAEILTYNITPSSSILPPGVSITTDFFGAFIPELSKRYPHMDMVLDLQAGKYPDAVVANNTINLNVPGTLVAMVKLPNNTLTTVFTLGLVIFTKAEVTLASRSGAEVIGFQDTLLSINIKLISSEIGTFDVNTLQKTLQLIANSLIIPDINKYGTNGIPVPTVSGLSFVDPIVVLGNNYILIATDVNYKPSNFA